MQVSNLRAEADPRGGRINLSWVAPRRADFPDFRGVKVLRREGSYPDPKQVAAEPGIFADEKTPPGLPASFSDAGPKDAGLKGETVYYYAVAAYDAADPPAHFVSYVSALATTDYGAGRQMYDELPDQYHRFDTRLPPAAPTLAPEDLGKGQLRRLVEMFGLQFDLLRSHASGMRDFYDLERIDGALLPLLAQWLGWQTDFSLPFSKQRNEIRYAPHFYRTTGIAANLKATLNRLTNWDAQFKEFAHSVLLSNDPEKLTIGEATRRGGQWGEPRATTLDWSFEGRPSVVKESEDQQWLFYHAREDGRATRGDWPAPPPKHPPKKSAADAPADSGTAETAFFEFAPAAEAPAAAEADAAAASVSSSGPVDFSHVWFKLCNFGEWLPAQRITSDDTVNRAPSAVRRKADGSFLVFHHALEQDDAGAYVPRLRLSLLAAGRPFQPARLRGTQQAPFALAAGDALTVTVETAGRALSKTVIFYPEDFADITKATAREVAALLERETWGVAATAAEGAVHLTSLAAGANVSVSVQGSAAAKLGLPASGASAQAVAAELLGGRSEPFALADGDTLVVKVDGGLARAVTFRERQFGDITKATAEEVAAVLKTYLPRSARVSQGRLRLVSPNAGAASSVALDVSASSAAPKLGLGVPPPPSVESSLSESEPAAFEDAAGGLWLFWSARAAGGEERIHYSRFDGAAWGVPLALQTKGTAADREPAVLYDPAPGGLIWLFWSGRKPGGRWNVYYRTTPNTDFATHAEGDWTHGELPFPAGAGYDNREPAAFLRGANRAELYYTSNRADGQNVWTAVVSPGSQQDETQVTKGQFTHRAPAVAGFAGGGARLWFRTNASQVYDSALYPAARTVDARYSGSTTIDARNPAKFGISGYPADVMHYTYDTGRGNDDWYARDTVGIYLTPDTGDASLIIRKRNQIESLLRKFLPIQVRGVIIIQQVFPENVYTYDFPEIAPPLRIKETMIDSVLGEAYKWPQKDSHADAVDFRFFRLWDGRRGVAADEMPDAADHPPDTSARLFLKNVKEGD